MGRIGTFINKLQAHPNAEYYIVYPRSVRNCAHGAVFMAQDEQGGDKLYFYGERCPFDGVKKTDGNTVFYECGLSHANAQVLRELFPFCAPQKVLTRPCTIGTGDRLGIAAAGQIGAIRKYAAAPVLAQQSMRELTLTGRTFQSVMDDVTFSVFREGYTGGYGADGDHLKTMEEIGEALACGYTMITLDLSEQIHDPAETRAPVCEELRECYLDRSFRLDDGYEIRFSEDELQTAVTIYGEAIDYAEQVARKFFSEADGQADLEISIDETSVPTTPQQHFFVANELRRRKVRFATIAPRFTGEFQKGIDYIGDINRFEQEMKIHAAIARTQGYKLSVHSGSDKFSIFPIVGKHTNGVFHLKTSGTSWLEAMKLAALQAPELYRQIHKYALTVFEQAKANYHVSAKTEAIPDVERVPDELLPRLFEDDNARQLIHITYGYILRHPVFGPMLRALWKKEQRRYDELVEYHITRHLEGLSVPYTGEENDEK
ncbi:MAG: tagaturonate epimerase family protein [Eubacteriales bacterium]|nr:tagaturonate epimerase family protein [Eubacteriales bacterium]